MSVPDERFDTSHLKGDLRGRTVRGAAVTLAAQSARFVLETVRIIVLARLLVPADYGLVAMVTAITNLIGMFNDLGLALATVTREEITHAQVSTLFWVNFAVSTALCAATIALAPALSWFYDEPRVLPIAFALAPTFILSGLIVQHQALLRRQMRFSALAKIRIGSVAGGIAMGVAFALGGAGYWALVAMAIAGPLVNVVAVWMACKWRPGMPQRGVGARDLVSFGMRVTGDNLLRHLSLVVPQMLLGWRSGAVALGLYTKSFSLVTTPMNRLLTPIGSVVVPSINKLVQEPARYRAAYLRIFEKIALIVGPVGVVMFVTADWLIPFALGSQWTEAAPIFAILAVFATVQPIIGSIGWLFVTQNRTHHALRLSVIQTGIAVLCVAVGVLWGAIGVAVAMAISRIVHVPLSFWYVGREGPVRTTDLYRTLATPAIGTAMAAAVLFGLRPYAEGLSAPAILAGTLVVTAATMGGTLLTFPAGRHALRDLVGSASLLVRSRRRPSQRS